MEKHEKYIDRYSDDPDGWNDLYADAGSRSADAITIACYPGSTADLKYQYNVKKEYLKWGEEHIRTAPADRVLQAGLYQKDEIIYELLIPEGGRDRGRRLCRDADAEQGDAAFYADRDRRAGI